MPAGASGQVRPDHLTEPGMTAAEAVSALLGLAERLDGAADRRATLELIGGALADAGADVGPLFLVEDVAGRDRSAAALVARQQPVAAADVVLARRALGGQVAIEAPERADGEAAGTAPARWRAALPLGPAGSPLAVAVAELGAWAGDDPALWATALARACSVALERAGERERHRYELAGTQDAPSAGTHGAHDEHGAADGQGAPSLRPVLDSLFVFVAVLDPAGNLVEANRAALDAGGVERAAAVGRPFWEAPWWSHDVAVQRRLREVVDRARAGIGSRCDLEIRVVDDTRTTIDLQVAPLPGGDGSVAHIICSGLDITARRLTDAERERRLDDERLARERAEAMQRLAEALGSATDSNEVYDALARAAARAVGADYANVGVRSERSECIELRHGPGLPRHVTAPWTVLPLDRSNPLGMAFESRAMCWAGDVAAMEETFTGDGLGAVSAGLQAVGAIPIINADGEVVAAIGFGWVHPRPLSSGLHARLASLAAVAGQALERARRFDAERHVADALQQVLLPASLPHFPTLGLAARYLAGESTLAVGGDWYECFEPEPGRLVVAVGDVVGRGLEAAATVGQLRAAVAALATTAPSPAALLERLDEFVRHFPAAVCTTVVCLEVTLATGSVRYACAGHPPPVLIRTGGTATLLEDGRSTPLGIVAGARPGAEVTLEEGDRLLLYTDGLVERRGETIEAGLQRLCRAALQGIDQRADALFIDEVVNVVIPSHADDDVCILLLHRRAEPGHLAVRVEGGAPGLAGARHSLRAWLEAAGASTQAIDETVLAAGEALGNAIEHAYFEQRATPQVSLRAAVRGTTLELVVQDGGRWRDVAAPGPRGRGLMLMRRLMDQVEVVPGPAGTRVTMRRMLEDDR